MERMLLPAQVRVALRKCAWLSPRLWQEECKNLGVPLAVVRKLMVQSPEKLVVTPTIDALRDPLSFCYSLVLERARPFVDEETLMQDDISTALIREGILPKDDIDRLIATANGVDDATFETVRKQLVNELLFHWLTFPYLLVNPVPQKLMLAAVKETFSNLIDRFALLRSTPVPECVPSEMPTTVTPLVRPLAHGTLVPRPSERQMRILSFAIKNMMPLSTRTFCWPSAGLPVVVKPFWHSTSWPWVSLAACGHAVRVSPQLCKPCGVRHYVVPTYMRC